MFKHKRSITMLVVISVLALGIVACNLPFRAESIEATEAPSPQLVEGQVVQSSEEALQSFSDKWRYLNMSTPTGPFSVTFTEAEVTAALNQVVVEAEQRGVDIPPINNIQVELENGTISISGVVRVEPINVNANISAVPSIDSNGLVDLTITDASFGVLDLDQADLNELEQAAEQAINEPIQSSPFDITLTEIGVANGEIRMSGTIN